jgi:multiple sugar transport system substrate-binding protein
VTGVELRGITWDHERGLGGLRATAEEYGRRRPDVRVRWTVRSLQDFAVEPVDRLSERFDLIYIDHPAIGYAVARDCLVPLDECLDPAFVADHDRQSVGRSAESYRWDGHLWALATDGAAQVSAFRPDLLERSGIDVPRTWEEVVAAASALRRQGLWVAVPTIPVDAVCAFLALCVAGGAEPFGGDSVVSRDVGRDALRTLRRVVEEAHPESTSWNPPRTLERMSTQDDVAYCPLAFGYSNYARPGFRANAVRFTGGPAGADGVLRGTLGGAGLALSSRSSHVDEAVAYAAYVADPHVQRTVYFEGGGQPGHRSAWTDPEVNEASRGFFADTLAAVDAAYLRPRFDGFLHVQERAGTILHRWLRGAGEVESVLDDLDACYRQVAGTAERVSGA